MLDPVLIAARYFDQHTFVPTTCITLSVEVRALCEQNRCGNYGRNWTCPPAVASFDHFRERLSEFDAMLILTDVYTIKDSFDWRGMKESIRQFNEKLLALKKHIASVDDGFRFFILGAGACHLCEPCNYVNRKPCRHPEEAIVSLEACGIDVMRLLKQNGLPYYHGKGTITYVGGLFYNR